MPAVLAAVIASVIWGAAPPIFKFALQDIPPFTLAFIRFFFAGLLLLPYIIRHFKKLKGKYIFDIVLGGIWGVSVNVGALFTGLKYAPSINVHIITALSPIVLYTMSLMLLKEKAHSQIIKGMFISLFGVAFIVLGPLIKSGFAIESGYSVQSQLIGNGFFLVAMFGAVMILIHTKKVVKKVHPITITGIQFFVGAITFLPFMMNELQTWSFHSLTTPSWIGIIYGIFFSSAAGYLLHHYALSKMRAQEIGVFNYIMPVIAVIVAIPLLGEFPDAFFLIGALFVLLGMYISERHPHYRKMHSKLHKE